MNKNEDVSNISIRMHMNVYDICSDICIYVYIYEHVTANNICIYNMVRYINGHTKKKSLRTKTIGTTRFER